MITRTNCTRCGAAFAPTGTHWQGERFGSSGYCNHCDTHGDDTNPRETMPKAAPLTVTGTDLDEAVEKAEEAFWASIAGAHPTITTGDLDPYECGQLGAAMRRAARAWLRSNAPSGSTIDGAPIYGEEPEEAPENVA